MNMYRLKRVLYSDVSCSSEVSISIYMRHPPSAKGEATRTTNDFFLGGVKIQPNFESTKIEDQVLNIVGGTGAMHIQLCYRPQQVNVDILAFLICSIHDKLNS